MITSAHPSARVVLRSNFVMMLASPAEQQPAMSEEQEGEQPIPSPPPSEEPEAETLTDWFDRMDREAFRRALAQRDLRIVSTTIRVQR